MVFRREKESDCANCKGHYHNKKYSLLRPRKGAENRCTAIFEEHLEESQCDSGAEGTQPTKLLTLLLILFVDPLDPEEALEVRPLCLCLFHPRHGEGGFLAKGCKMSSEHTITTGSFPELPDGYRKLRQLLSDQRTKIGRLRGGC